MLDVVAENLMLVISSIFRIAIFEKTLGSSVIFVDNRKSCVIGYFDV